MPHAEIVSQELLHFIRKVSARYAGIKQGPIHDCIWTRTTSFLGDRIPVWPPGVFNASDQLLLHKNWEDMQFFIPIEELIDLSSTISPDSLMSLYDVDDSNCGKAHVRREHRSFKGVFLAELMHAIKENERHWHEAIAYLYALETGNQNALEFDALPEEAKIVARNLLWHAFRKNRVSDELPSYHIPAGLYAAACWDATRQLTKNDVLDFAHAQLAIPYCDVFLTETSLKSFASSDHLKFDEIYHTKIIAAPDEAVAFLRKDLNSRAKADSVVRELFEGDTYARAALM